MCLNNCCECFLFDWECLKKEASLPVYMKEDNVNVIWAVNTTHRQNIKSLIQKDCYNDLCKRSKEEKNATNYDPSVEYATGQTVIYNNVVYISLQDANLGNDPGVSPTFWVVAGLRTVDKELIKLLQPYAGYTIEYYYRAKDMGGVIENDTILINLPENKSIPNAKGIQITLDLLQSSASNEIPDILKFIKDNSASYPCFKSTDCGTCEEKMPTNIPQNPFLIID